MTLKYLRKLRPILNKVGKKHGITVEEGELIIDEFFKSFKNAINDPRIPKVKFPCFGTFKPKRSFIYRSLKASIYFHRLGGSTREYINARVKRLWPVRNRLIEEERGGYTYLKWKKKAFKEHIQKLSDLEKEAKERSRKAVYGGDSNPKNSKDFIEQVSRRLREEGRTGGGK